MKTPIGVKRLIVHAITIIGIAALGWSPQLLGADKTPLRILLTNDDGFNAPGIKAIYAKLVAAGHQVTLVAPLTNQSASGIRLTTSGLISYKEQSPGIWSVDGSPADSVLVGLNHILKDSDSPDIVVSGANFGQNVARASSSGTVGAATMAMYRGFPAIAVSVGIDRTERDAQPVPFPSTLGAFDGAAALTLKLIDNLQEAQVENEGLLPELTLLNVNYPAVSPEEIRGVRMARAAKRRGFGIGYEETGQANQLRAGLRRLENDRPANDNADLELFSQGYVTISVLDGDWDAGPSIRESISKRLPMTGQE